MLVPGGVCCIHAWATDQGQESRRVFKGSDCLVPWTKSGHAADTGISTGISFSEAGVDPSKSRASAAADAGSAAAMGADADADADADDDADDDDDDDDDWDMQTSNWSPSDFRREDRCDEE